MVFIGLLSVVQYYYMLLHYVKNETSATGTTYKVVKLKIVSSVIVQIRILTLPAPFAVHERDHCPVVKCLLVVLVDCRSPSFPERRTRAPSPPSPPAGPSAARVGQMRPGGARGRRRRKKFADDALPSGPLRTLSPAGVTGCGHHK